MLMEILQTMEATIQETIAMVEESLECRVAMLEEGLLMLMVEELPVVTLEEGLVTKTKTGLQEIDNLTKG